LVLLVVASCSDDDAAPVYTATGTMSLKLDNVSNDINNPVVEVEGAFANFTANIDGDVYFAGTTEPQYTVHLELEQHDGGFSVTGYDLIVKRETPDGYTQKNYHAFANGTAVSNWMQSGSTSNMYEPKKTTEGSGEFSGYIRENDGSAEGEIYISGNYSLFIQ
jgi:hypothetical protein